jgi:diguanylate cyclase (GGDEF)-like protein
MTEEGKEVLAHLRKQVEEYQTKLEEAEEVASRDALTGVSSRLFVENQIQKVIAVGSPLCVGLIDIDGFKRVNDEHGHLTGDELLKQFAGELRSICRTTDLIGRWGGDEFIFLFKGRLAEAEAQTDRLRKWVCGDYTVKQTSAQGRSGTIKVRVDASIGLTEYVAGEGMKELVARADAAMYERKAAARTLALQQAR